MQPRFLAFIILALMSVPAPAVAQLDPLLFLKQQTPNVLIAVDTANRMQRDMNNDYRDDNIYKKLGTSWETAMGISSSNTTQYYRRKFVKLLNVDTGAGGNDKFETDYIDIVGDKEAEYATFDAATKINIVKRSLHEAVTRNSAVARFGLLHTRQSNPRFVTPASGNTAKWDLNEGPVRVTGTGPEAVAQQADSPLGGGRFSITRPVVSTANGSIAGPLTPLVPVATGSNATVLSTLSLATGANGSLIPAGRDAKSFTDAPVDNMLDDLKAEAQRLLMEPNCRNTVAILVVGGGDGDSTNEDPASKASSFLSVYANHRVPIYVIAIAPPAGDVDELKAIATNSGGEYAEITAAMAAAAGDDNPVPELVRAVNRAIQHAFAAQADFDTAPTVALPTGPLTEHQVTSPIIGTVDLRGGKDINGVTLEKTDIKTSEDTPIPQRANVMITSGFSLPGFDGKLRAFRVYKPVVDSTKPSGYKFVQDGTRLWVGCAPGTTSSGTCSTLTTSQRNIYTVLPNSNTLVPLTAANAAQLQPYMGGLTATQTETVIDYVRSQPLGAIVDSTPALMDAPSLDPPPDADYPGFAAANSGRRSMIWVGANDGMLHAIDARLGVEVWAFVPFNMLPKLKALRSGQPVGDFVFSVDGSPKVADVKVAGTWRTYLIMGQGPGGTFYQTFDVTLDDMAATAPSTSDTIGNVLSYFEDADSVQLKWTFPRYSVFDTTILPYGELSTAASAVEKTVGETWSDPAVGQVESASGKFVVLTGSGFLKYSVQQSSRGGVNGGTTFYVLDAATGAVLDSRDVGYDGLGETGTAGDSCDAANDCTRIKNALQADPVATGPSDSRFITRAYLGDLDGKIWRFDVGLDGGGSPKIKATLNLFTIGAAGKQPIFSSMATVNIGGSQQYLFVGTGSDLLPSDNVNYSYGLYVILDTGSSGKQTAVINLEKTDGTGIDEKVTSFPAVAGDIVFFSTTSYKPTLLCGVNVDANLYAFTFIGGPAYDTTGDGKLTSNGGSADSTKVRTTSGARATSPFIVDQHVAFGTGTNVEMFGDPQDYNNGVGQVGVRILSWREVR